MKTPKLIRKARDFFDNDKSKRKGRVTNVKELLKKLKKKKHSLKDKLDREKDSKEKKRIETDIHIIQAQRKKGLKLLKKLRE